jgi:hypothetical protein
MNITKSFLKNTMEYDQYSETENTVREHTVHT